MADEDDNVEPGESFEEFKNSFSYSTRTDLDAKFLATLDEDDAAAFFRELIRRAVAVADGVDAEPESMARFLHGWQEKAYSKPGRFSYDEAPFTPLAKPLSDARVALITLSCHFVDRRCSRRPRKVRRYSSWTGEPGRCRPRLSVWR